MITQVNAMMPLLKDISTQNIGADIKQQSFKDFINQEISQLSRQQEEADDNIKALITGDVDNTHDLLIKTEEARLQLELAMQVRNKVVESYQEIMRMQV